MATDFLLDEQDDLLIRDGDLVVGPSEQQEIGLIVRLAQGELRAAPLTGFGIARRLRGEADRDSFSQELDTQLRLDGFTDSRVALADNGTLTVQATRND